MLVLVWQRQYVTDQLTVWGFTPSSEVVSIAQEAAFSEEGIFYFYASRPEVDDAERFNAVCERQEEQSAILGCYAGQKIYIYNVTDPRLKGIKEVTAAHEMLHAAWDRLSENDQDKLAVLLEAEAKKYDSKELQSRMAYYERTQPGERANELHSIIGTEYRDMSAELERHYARYFTDRKLLVAIHDDYNKVFKELEEKSEKLLGKIETLKRSVDRQLSSYDKARLALEEEDRQIQALYGAVDRSDPGDVAAYNARVQGFNANVAELKRQYTAVNRLINQYNATVKEYNDTAMSRQGLQDSIDSVKAPRPIEQS